MNPKDFLNQIYLETNQHDAMVKIWGITDDWMYDKNIGFCKELLDNIDLQKVGKLLGYTFIVALAPLQAEYQESFSNYIAKYIEFLPQEDVSFIESVKRFDDKRTS